MILPGKVAISALKNGSADLYAGGTQHARRSSFPRPSQIQRPVAASVMFLKRWAQGHPRRIGDGAGRIWEGRRGPRGWICDHQRRSRMRSGVRHSIDRASGLARLISPMLHPRDAPRPRDNHSSAVVFHLQSMRGISACWMLPREYPC